MLALHECFLSSQLQRDGILPTWPLVAAHHSPNIALGFRESSKQAPTKKQNKATLSDIQQIKTMSFLRKLDHSKKKVSPGHFCKKKIPLKFQALTTHFVETNLQPRDPTVSMASSNPAEVPGTAARRTERKRSWMQRMSLSVFLYKNLNPPSETSAKKKNLRVAKTRPFWGLKFDTQTEGLGTYPST